MELEALGDDALLGELHRAQQDILGIYANPDQGRAAWQRVIDVTRELERRYPPASEPLP